MIGLDFDAYDFIMVERQVLQSSFASDQGVLGGIGGDWFNSCLAKDLTGLY